MYLLAFPLVLCDRSNAGGNRPALTMQDTTTTTTTTQADLDRLAIISQICETKGQYLALAWKSEKKPSKDHKGKELVKITRATVRAGIDYANLGTVRDGIASGERGEVEPLPWGEWFKFPYLIQHKGEIYVRLYPTAQARSTYKINGSEVSKGEFESCLPPSERESGNAPACFTVKARNILTERDLA